MLHRSLLILACLASSSTLVPAPPQMPPTVHRNKEDVRLPNGKLQRDEILKADHEKNLEDASRLAKMAEELRSDLEKSDSNVLSIDLLKQTEEIEKIARRIRGRMKRY